IACAAASRITSRDRASARSALFARVALDTGAGDTAALHSTTALRTYTGEIDSGATQLAFDGYYALSINRQLGCGALRARKTATHCAVSSEGDMRATSPVATEHYANWALLTLPWARC